MVVDDNPFPLDAERIQDCVQTTLQLGQVFLFVERRGDDAEESRCAPPADIRHSLNPRLVAAPSPDSQPARIRREPDPALRSSFEHREATGSLRLPPAN